MATEDELYDELDAWIAGDAGDPSEAAADLEPPEDAAQAERLLRGRWRLQEDERKVSDVAKAEKAKVEEWAQDRLSGIRRRIVQIDRLLEGWMRAVARDNPKRKTEKLPHGTLKLRGTQYSIEPTDDETVLAWVKANRPDLVRVKEEPKLGELKAACKPGSVVSEHEGVKWYAVVAEGGEVVPGVVRVKADEDKFSVS
jgi:phage host-nuclease inhibitor protein Gam